MSSADPSTRAALACLATLTATYTVDQLSKSWAVKTLWLSPPVEVIAGWLELRLHFNDGAAFGIGAGRGGWLLIPPMMVALALVAWLVRVRPGPAVWAIAGAVLGGIAGNAGDRVFRVVPGFGHTRKAVVDFIAVLPGRWPAFNVADLAIVAGGVALLWAHARSFRSATPRDRA